MNNTRRKELYSAIDELESLLNLVQARAVEFADNEDLCVSVSGDISSVADQIDTLYDEEQDAYDNLPEGLQLSERGETMCDNIDALDNCRSEIEDAASDIEDGNVMEAIGLLESAISYANSVE